MANVWVVESWLSLALMVALLGLKAYAFVNACLWSEEAYRAADKLTKPAWLAILGIAIVLQLPILGGGLFAILNLAGTIAAIVYIVDVRPRLLSVTGRR